MQYFKYILLAFLLVAGTAQGIDRYENAPSGDFIIDAFDDVAVNTFLGIGTTDPVSPLEIAVDASGATADSITLTDTNAGGYGTYLKWKDNWATDGGGVRAAIRGDVPASDRGRLSFYTQSAASTLTERMTIDENVGINGTGLAGKLGIYDTEAGDSVVFQIANSTTGVSSFDGLTIVQSDSGQIVLNQREAQGFDIRVQGQNSFGISSASKVAIGGVPQSFYQLFINSAGTTSATHALFAQNSARNILSARDDGAVLTNSGTIDGSLSDRRLKKNIRPIIDGLKTLNKLRPSTFDWKYPEHHRQATQSSFIAQEVQKVRPDWVQKGLAHSEELKGENLTEEEILTTKFHDLDAYMVAAIQDLSKENKAMKTWICSQSNAPEALCN